MADARPYLDVGSDDVRAGAWCLVGEPQTPLPEWIASWDISQTLKVRRDLEVNLDRMRAEARLPTGRFAVSVVYVSEFEDEACRVTIDQDSGVVPIELQLELDGKALGGSVALLTSLVLADVRDNEPGPVAWRRGSILWQDMKKLRLYGEASQFPLLEADFKALHLDPASPWFLQIGSDLELPAMGSIVLMLNERFPLVTEAVRALEVGRPELAVVRAALYVGVGRVLVETALSHDGIIGDWPEESLGAVLSALLATRFPESVDELRQLRERDSAAWAALLDARFGFLREPLR